VSLSVAVDVTFARRNLGGGGVYARELLEALAACEGVRPTEISGPAAGGLAGTLRWLLVGARHACAGFSPDLVHCPAFVAPWNLPVPYVVTIHDLSSRRFPEDHPFEWRVYERRMLPALARRAAMVLTGSDHARQSLIEGLGLDPDRVVVTPYGLGERYRRQLARPVPGPTEGAALLFVGAPVRRKNLELVLRLLAAAAPGSALRRARLEIAGASAADFPRHRQWIEAHGLRGRVSWLGRVTEDGLLQAYRRAAALVYPSLHEGFGFPPLEAMAVGIPVVASNATCLPEVLGDAALLEDPADEAAFARALEEVLSRPGLRARLVEAGRRRATLFTWSRCAELTVRAYREALEAA
jgi:glycosyltransferase involved in cell wall biosynthesis